MATPAPRVDTHAPWSRGSPLVAVGAALACVPVLLFPGDAPFINDEAVLVLHALRANAAHRLADVGLVGTKGLPYGPLPTWTYQALLAVTHDPLVLVVLHAALFAGVTATALLWLSRALALPPLFVPVLLLSPYLWFYARVLWDNPLLLPISALLLAAYADYLVRRRPAALAVALACLVAALLVHLMALALVLPVAAHLAVVARRDLRRHPWTLAAPALLAIAAAPYGRALAAAVRAGAAARAAPALDGFLFPLGGPLLLGATGLDYFVGAGWLPPWLRVVAATTALLHALAGAGIALALLRVARAIRARSATPADHVAGLALAVLATQSVLDGVTRASGHPHYHNATWIAHALLAWLALDALARARRPAVRALRHLVVPVGAALATVTIGLLASVHATGGTRELNYGPAIAVEIEVARTLGRHPAQGIETDVENFQRFPHALDALRALLPRDPAPAEPMRRIVVRYASADPRDAHVVIERE